MLCYKDMTFCVSSECPYKCNRYATDLVFSEARKEGLPLSQALFFLGGACVARSGEKKND